MLSTEVASFSVKTNDSILSNYKKVNFSAIFWVNKNLPNKWLYLHRVNKLTEPKTEISPTKVG